MNKEITLELEVFVKIETISCVDLRHFEIQKLCSFNLEVFTGLVRLS